MKPNSIRLKNRGAHHGLVLALALTLATPAQARVIDSADSVGYSYQGAKKTESIWTQIQSKATAKVNEWMGFFKGTQERDVASSSVAVPVPVDVAVPVSVKTEETKQFAEVIQKTKEQVSGKDAIVVANPGRVGTSALPASKRGVPRFAFTTRETVKDKKTGKMKTVNVAVKEIPRLDIGVEKTISKNDFIPVDMKVNLKTRQKVTELASPSLFSNKEIKKAQSRPLPEVAKAKAPSRGEFKLGQLVSKKKIEAVSLMMQPTNPVAQMKEYTDVSSDELKMIMAVILFQKKDKCHLASGLLHSLSDNRALADEANFYLGVCAHQMGFHSEAVNRLLRVVEAELSEYTKEAVTNLVEDLPREYDQRVAAAIKAMKNQSFIADEARDNVNFVLARAAHGRDAYAETAMYAQKVSEQSPRYADARYLYGVGLYGDKKSKEAELALLALREWMIKKNNTDKNLTALVAVNLARIRFTQGRYQAAYDEYMKVPKDSPHWVQALIEQGWVQLSIDDPEGAIGNMYSLHSPYFKSVFMPESWVVRTIGYIDICQYGDAYRTLTKAEQLHGSWLSSVTKYMKAKRAPSAYYSTVKNYIRGRSDANVDGLPSQIIREVARQRGFLNAQNSINVLEDEIAQYGFIFGLVKKDQAEVAGKISKAKARVAALKANIKKIKTTPTLASNLNEWMATVRNEERLIRSYQFQAEVYEQARLGFQGLRAAAIARINKDQNRLRTVAGRELIAHLKGIHGRIEQIVEGNEFLRYEIFSGSGENIRYQVAGGATSDSKRIPANVKPQKILNWEFDGEYWEDEIGSYRSTLKNNCPKNAQAAQGTGYLGSPKNL